MDVDLDALEAAAGRVTGSDWWDAEKVDSGTVLLVGAWEAKYIALLSPTVVLALIARIRELEERLDDVPSPGNERWEQSHL